MNFEKKLKFWLSELHKSYLKGSKNLGCSARAEILYYLVKNSVCNPKIVRYKKPNGKINHISSGELPSHVVVILEGLIYDANLESLKGILKQIYEKDIIDTFDFEDYKPVQSKDQLLHYMQEKGLSKNFISQFVESYESSQNP